MLFSLPPWFSNSLSTPHVPFTPQRKTHALYKLKPICCIHWNGGMVHNSIILVTSLFPAQWHLFREAQFATTEPSSSDVNWYHWNSPSVQLVWSFKECPGFVTDSRKLTAGYPELRSCSVTDDLHQLIILRGHGSSMREKTFHTQIL